MLSVQELLQTPSLGLTCLAGQQGTVRLIGWAHTVELPDPWHWVSAGDLVMTTGLGLPAEAESQVHWLKQLSLRKISALLCALAPTAPPLSKELLQAAERLRLPLLGADFSLEFARLSRLVIGSVLRAERLRFATLEGLFQHWAKALHEQQDLSERLAQMGDYLHLNLALEDEQSGRLIASTTNPPLAEPSEALSIGGRSQARLRLWPRDNHPPSASGDKSLLLRSLVGLLALELERQRLERDSQRREGAALLHQLLQADSELSIARPLLEQRGLFGALVLLAAQPPNRELLPDLHHRLALHGLSPLMLEQDGLFILLAADTEENLSAIFTQLGKPCPIGISSTLAGGNGFAEGLRQARLALAQAKENGQSVQRYGEAAVGLLPHSLSEARLLVERSLSALMDYDQQHGSALLTTLMQFLDNNSQYKATCLELGIHRQTLVYRLKLIEQLTKLKPSTSEGLARLWLAVQAGKAAGLL